MTLLLSSVVCFFFGFVFGFNSISYFMEWELFSWNGVNVVCSLIFDWMSLIFLGSVCLISGCIMKYSVYYMQEENNFLRFVFIILFFVGSMCILILSPNLISILLGWDGLGLTSYALVIFYQNSSSCNGGMLTVLSNRIGDVFILMSISIMFISGGWNFFFEEGGWLVCLFVILASCTKSAQVPFSAWLPAAMAAPTPVSALVHSSTLVTAGVYLLIRFNKSVMGSGLDNLLLAVSVMTMLMAGLSANFETDMKKVIALSTLSQLGLMIMVLSMGEPDLAYFHMITHAMFKSSLFMCAGFMIHSINGSQDSRNVSNFSSASPLLMSLFSCLNLALTGFPFLAGFYSKDLMLENMWENSMNFFLVSAIVLGTGLTMSYSFRLVYLVNSGVSTSTVVKSSSVVDYVVFKSIVVLFLFSVVVGFFFFWLFSNIFAGFILTSLNKYYIMLVSVISGVATYYTLNFSSHTVIKKEVFVLGEGIGSMWFMPFFSTKFMSKNLMVLSWLKFKLVDSGWLEYYGGQGGHNFFMGMSGWLQLGQKSILVMSYLMFFVTSMILFYILV